MSSERRDATDSVERSFEEKPRTEKNVVWREEDWQKHHQWVEAYCYRMLPGNDWQNAAQEVFEKAFENWDTLRASDKTVQWLSVIARRHCLNILRGNRESLIPFEELADHYLRAEPAPYTEVENRILHTQLLAEIRRRAVLCKPPWDKVDWDIFEAFYGGEKRTAKEVAAILRMDFNNVRYRFNHHIRPLLEEVGTLENGKD